MKKINPSVKALVILACGILISFHYSILGNGILILACLVQLFIAGVRPRRLIPVLLPATLAALSLSLAFVFHGNRSAAEALPTGSGFLAASLVSGNVGTGIALATRIYAYALLGMLFSFTTEANAFLYSLMQQLHLPPKFAYGVLSAYHLLPLIKREYQQLRLAYQVRGIPLCPWSLKPAFPALVNATLWAENIAMAMESKGFEENGARTFYLKLSVRPMDILWGIGMILLALAGLWL